MQLGLDMLVGAIALLFLISSSGVVARLSAPKDHFMSRDMTCSINGLFIMVVFLSHLRQYIPKEAYGSGDRVFLWVMTSLGQLMVATFLFFSGYGIMESIRRKDLAYVRSLPGRRILPFLLDVWIALVPFLALRLVRSNPPTLDDVLLSMVGWRGIGNSNWYIFAILVMYVATYAGFRMARDRHAVGVFLVAVACALYCRLMISQGAGKWYYDTIFCYPAGMLWSLALHRLQREGTSDWPSGALGTALVLLACAAAVVLLKGVGSRRALVFNARAIAFALAVTYAYRLLPANGRPFSYLGAHLFFFYIYQRIPMIVFAPLAGRPLPYACLCLATVIPLCMAMTMVHAWAKGRLLAEWDVEAHRGAAPRHRAKA